MTRAPTTDRVGFNTPVLGSLVDYVGLAHQVYILMSWRQEMPESLSIRVFL